MIFRRLKAHVEKENWFAVFIDFCIVVIGVFIGIQVANWNAARADALREATYLERLGAEFEVINRRIDRGLETFGSSVAAAQRLIEIHDMGPEGSADITDQELADLFERLTRGVVPPSSPSAFNEMVSTGDLTLLSNNELRSALYEYDEFSEIARMGFEIRREEISPPSRTVQGWLRYDLDLGNIAGYGARAVSVDRDAFLSSDVAVREITVILSAQSNVYVLFAEQQGLANTIQTLLDGEQQK